MPRQLPHSARRRSSSTVGALASANAGGAMLRRPAKPYMTRGDYDEAVRQPAIVHFTPLFMLGNRPWHKGYNRHPYAKAYDAYKAQSPWRDVPYQQDPRGAKAMAVVRICSLIPRRLLTGIVGTIYGVYYPLKIRRKSRWQAIA